ncbi:acyltransferase family-domain-containing protein [Podospora aff. communis PSN243]|uniref:Acyltransferase family-domain-containing protein n=1 Tax=Podospora aff. communis PSN243 TaxID=3040156 RepID=A0AAV9H2X2_9PEZI|nr:acyltransferase family-domain-containing protein [Podospora aff. communis PSN243]
MAMSSFFRRFNAPSPAHTRVDELENLVENSGRISSSGDVDEVPEVLNWKREASSQLTNAGTLLWSLGHSLLPSFLRRRQPTSAGDSIEKAQTPRHAPSTSSLDGLRGYAALAVMNYHIFYAYQSFVFYGYGLSPSAAATCARPEDVGNHNLWLHQVPVVRMLYNGTWAISVFFVVSGFALSYKPLRESLAQNFSFTRATRAVASSLLRRPVRLYLPPVIATFITMVVIQLGGYEHGRVLSHDHDLMPVIREPHQARLASFWLQLGHWFGQTWRMLNIFWWGDVMNQYDAHLWTISAEFRCSLAVFLVLPVYVNIKTTVRRVFIVLVVLYVYFLDRWDVALFLCGALIADTAVSRSQANDAGLPGNNDQANVHGFPSTTRSRARIRAMAAIAPFFKAVLLALSLLMLSAPDFCISETPGYQLLGRLTPASDPTPFRFVPNLGGIILVALVAHATPSNWMVATLLNARLPQYLGRISYSLYIVHGPLIHTLGYAVFPLFWSITGREETWRYVVGFAAAYVVLVGTVVLVADVFWRAVDMPCVRLGKRFEKSVCL